MMKKYEFGRATAEQHGHAIFKLTRCHQETVLRRPLYGVAKSPYSTWDNRNLLDGVLPGQRNRHDGVAEFVISDDAAFLGNQQPVLLFETGHDAFHRGGKVAEMHAIGATPRCQQRRLVDKVRKVS